MKLINESQSKVLEQLHKMILQELLSTGPENIWPATIFAMLSCDYKFEVSVTRRKRQLALVESSPLVSHLNLPS